MVAFYLTAEYVDHMRVSGDVSYPRTMKSETFFL